MRRRTLMLTVTLALPLGTAWLIQGPGRGQAGPPATAAGYTCPMTGEDLPCPNCCPIRAK